MRDTMTQHNNNFKPGSILLAAVILVLLLPLIFLPEIESVVAGAPAWDQLTGSPSSSGRPAGTCYVSPNETITPWKGTFYTRCYIRFGSMCLWPIAREHLTYKITINDGSTPMRDARGSVIAATNSIIRSDWLTYDANSWNALANARHGYFQNRYDDYQTIAPDEYVVMVQTRYRLFNNVDSTLGICVQKP